MISTITGASGASGSTATKGARPEKSDADAFARALDKASEEKGNSKQAGEVISDDKAAKKEDKKDSKDKAEAQKVESPEQKLQQKQLSKLNGYLYDLALKNPDTMSLAEKQAMRMDEFATVGFQDLRVMLRERGINMRDLSFTQLALLTRDGSREQVSSTLDILMRDRTDDPKERRDLGNPDASAQFARELRNVAVEAMRPPTQEMATREQQRQVVIDQILQHIEVRNLANRTELSLKLNPEYLGDLRIKLTHGENGIKADFQTTSRATREVLEDSEEDLRTQVSSKGIRLNEVSVELVDAV